MKRYGKGWGKGTERVGRAEVGEGVEVEEGVFRKGARKTFRGAV